MGGDFKSSQPRPTHSLLRGPLPAAGCLPRSACCRVPGPVAAAATPASDPAAAAEPAAVESPAAAAAASAAARCCCLSIRWVMGGSLSAMYLTWVPCARERRGVKWTRALAVCHQIAQWCVRCGAADCGKREQTAAMPANAFHATAGLISSERHAGLIGSERQASLISSQGRTAGRRQRTCATSAPLAASFSRTSMVAMRCPTRTTCGVR